jgi:hypothetical protein
VVKLTVKLNPKAQKALKRNGKLRKKVKVTFSATGGWTSSVARAITFNAPANGKVN